VSRNQSDFYLDDVLDMVHEKNRDKLIEGLEALIENDIIIPSNT
jgi:hypothetical protein